MGNNGAARSRRPDPTPQTVRELMRPSKPLKERTHEETTATAEAWALASHNAVKASKGGTIGGKKKDGS